MENTADTQISDTSFDPRAVQLERGMLKAFRLGEALIEILDELLQRHELTPC
jgi:hypothetical protein